MLTTLAISNYRSLRRLVSTFDSMMTQLADPRKAPEVFLLRESIRAWRLYDHFRTDEAATRSPRSVRARLFSATTAQTWLQQSKRSAKSATGNPLVAAVRDAFPGGTLSVETADGRFQLLMKQHGLLRPLSAAELSGGTLRYLLWIAALLTARPPAVMVLDEPRPAFIPTCFLRWPVSSRRLRGARRS